MSMRCHAHPIDKHWTRGNTADMKRARRSSDPALDIGAERVPRHPIAVVATRTGLTPDVLRIWERRYAAVQPGRSADGQRLYSDADVERLRALRRAIDAGRSIGKVARLSTAGLRKMIAEDASVSPREPSRVPAAAMDDVVADCLVQIRALNATALDALLRRAAAAIGVAAFLERLAAPLLRRLGEEWHAGRLSIAHEHLASAVVGEVMTSAMRELASGRETARLVVATPTGERHSLGAVLVGAWAAADGWDVVFLGPDMPAEDIASAAIATNARAVAISSVYAADRRHLVREMRTLRERLPANITLLVGGAAASTVAQQLQAAGIHVAHSLDELGAVAGK